MSTRAQPLYLRIFLSSPGDVADERALALQLFERLQYDPLLRGQITIDAVAWDKQRRGRADARHPSRPRKRLIKDCPSPRNATSWW